MRTLALITLLLTLTISLTPTAVFAIATSSDGRIIPACDPSLLPNSTTTTNLGGPCGLNAFAQLLANIIWYLNIIIVPIAFCVIGYAGFTILTAAGNSERIQKGYGMIKIAVIGIIILVSTYVLMESIFSILLSTEGFNRTGLN